MRAVLLSLLGLLALAQSATAQLKSSPGDWPGWRGPARDDISKETGLLKTWPKGGPELVWKADGLGAGYSTPSIAKGVIYLLGTEQKNTECLIALDVKTGKKLWSTPFGKHTGGYPGPRSTPTVDGDTLYVISSDGVLISASTKGGGINWKKEFKKEFGGRHGSWAFAESPLIDGDVLICTPGGETAAIVALNKKNGDVIWKSNLSELKGGKRGYSVAGYSSPIVATVHGVKQYVQFLSGGVVGVDAKSGQLLWHYDAPANGTANISTPLQFGNAIFAASGYGKGGGLAKIVESGGKFEAEEAYFLKDMQNHHGGMLILDGHLYGVADSGNVVCLNLTDGTYAWKGKSVGKGSLTYADGKLYVRSERGPVALVEANPTAFKEISRFEQPERSNQAAWPHPVVAGGKLYLRDQDLLFCYDIQGSD